MSIVCDLHSCGFTAQEMLEQIQKIEYAKNYPDRTIYQVLYALKRQRNELKNDMSRSGYQIERIEIQEQIKTHNIAIVSLEKTAKRLFSSWGNDGRFWAIAYLDFNNPLSVVIPSFKWNFLKVDFENSVCYFQDRRYVGLRFLPSEFIKTLSDSEQKALISAIEPNPDSSVESFNTPSDDQEKIVDEKTKIQEIGRSLKIQYPDANTTDLLKYADELQEFKRDEKNTRRNGKIAKYLKAVGIKGGQRGGKAKPLVKSSKPQ